MNSKMESHIRAAFLGLSLSVIGVMAAVIGMLPMADVAEGQTERGGCQFQIYLRPPIEFAGPAGGGAADFRLYQPIKHRANVQVANVYGTQACSWSAEVNQNWVTLSQSGGTIQAEADTIVTVSINERATELSRGVHWAEITFTSRQDPDPSRPKKVKVKLHAQKPCDLQVIGGTYRARAVQGEVPQQPSVAKLTNSGDAPCRWEAHSDRTWLTVTPVGGELGPREEQRLTIRANSGVASLVPEDYNAVVLLQWRETHDEYKEIQAILEVDAPPCDLHFEPGQTFAARGKAGSTEFAPQNRTYVLENRGGTPCFYWQAQGLPRWLEIEDETTIYGKSQTDVLVRVNQSAAAELRPHDYRQNITFGAGTVSANNGLSAQITVDPLPCHLTVDEDDLFFRIEPEGLTQSATEKPITLRNHWTNEECHWQAEPQYEWLTANPPSGTLAGGDEITVTAKILSTSALSQLDAGDHLADLGFTTQEGTFDDPVQVTVSIACEPGQPCAYLHITHTQTAIGRPASIGLSLANGWQSEITAQLEARMPSGWELEGVGFADKCGAGVCNQRFKILRADTQIIEFRATPNNAGSFTFTARVTWTAPPPTPVPRETPATPQNLTEGNDSAQSVETDEVIINITNLSAEVEVIAPAAASPPQGQQTQATTSDPASQITATTPQPSDQAAQQQPTQDVPSQSSAMAPTAAPAATPEPEAPAPISPQNAPPGGGVTSVDDRRAADSGISMNLLGLGIAVVVIVLIAAVVGGILLGRRRRAPAPIDYDELARAMNRQQENPSPE